MLQENRRNVSCLDCIKDLNQDFWDVKLGVGKIGDICCKNAGMVSLDVSKF